MIRVAIVGLGYWGKNLARNVLTHPSYSLEAIVDTNLNVEYESINKFGASFFHSISEMLNVVEPDIVFISTRPKSHLNVMKQLVNRVRLVVLSKPAGASYDEANKIFQLSLTSETKLLVDYTYHYAPFITVAKEIFYQNSFDTNQLEIVSYRTALGIIQSDVSVVHDLLSHDLSICMTLLGSEIEHVQSIQTSASNFSKPTSALSLIRWKNGSTLTSHVSWTSPRKLRNLTITGPDKALVIKELDSIHKVELVRFNPIFDTKSTTSHQLQNLNISFGLGSSFTPEVELKESLQLELDCISEFLHTGRSEKLFDTNLALHIWRIMARLDESIKRGGQLVSAV